VLLIQVGELTARQALFEEKALTTSLSTRVRKVTTVLRPHPSPRSDQQAHTTRPLAGLALQHARLDLLVTTASSSQSSSRSVLQATSVLLEPHRRTSTRVQKALTQEPRLALEYSQSACRARLATTVERPPSLRHRPKLATTSLIWEPLTPRLQFRDRQATRALALATMITKVSNAQKATTVHPAAQLP